MYRVINSAMVRRVRMSRREVVLLLLSAGIEQNPGPQYRLKADLDFILRDVRRYVDKGKTVPESYVESLANFTSRNCKSVVVRNAAKDACSFVRDHNARVARGGALQACPKKWPEAEEDSDSSSADESDSATAKAPVVAPRAVVTSKPPPESGKAKAGTVDKPTPAAPKAPVKGVKNPPPAPKGKAADAQPTKTPGGPPSVSVPGTGDSDSEPDAPQAPALEVVAAPLRVADNYLPSARAVERVLAGAFHPTSWAGRVAGAIGPYVRPVVDTACRLLKVKLWPCYRTVIGAGSRLKAAWDAAATYVGPKDGAPEPPPHVPVPPIPLGLSPANVTIVSEQVDSMDLRDDKLVDGPRFNTEQVTEAMRSWLVSRGRLAFFEGAPMIEPVTHSAAAGGVGLLSVLHVQKLRQAVVLGRAVFNSSVQSPSLCACLFSGGWVKRLTSSLLTAGWLAGLGAMLRHHRPSYPLAVFEDVVHAPAPLSEYTRLMVAAVPLALVSVWVACSSVIYWVLRPRVLVPFELVWSPSLFASVRSCIRPGFPIESALRNSSAALGLDAARAAAVIEGTRILLEASEVTAVLGNQPAAGSSGF